MYKVHVLEFVYNAFIFVISDFPDVTLYSYCCIKPTRPMNFRITVAQLPLPPHQQTPLES